MADTDPTAADRTTAVEEDPSVADATAETLPSDDIEALLAAAAAGSVEMPPEDDEGTHPDDAVLATP
ncbi:MAG: hypothetical protein AAF907_06665, partial [Planctomycetota bacterium]